MNQEYSHQLIQLVQYDQETNELMQKLAQYENEVVQFQQEIKEGMQQGEKIQAELRADKKAVDSYELSIRESEAKEGAEKELLDRVRNQKEFKSVRAELDVIIQKRLNDEESLVAAWNRYENAEKKVKEFERDWSRRKEEFETEIEKRQNQLSELKTVLQKRDVERKALTAKVDSEWLEKYESMRLRVPNPLVLLDDGGCSACFYPVSNQDRRSIQSGKLLQCKGCYRFLYSMPVHEEL